VGGAIQVCTTIAVAAFVMSLNGLRFPEAVFFGFLISLSSTAIVMKVLQERGEVETVSGRTLLGILIFQDLAIIPMILVAPLLLGTSTTSVNSLPLAVSKVITILAILVVSAGWIVPALLYRVAKYRNRELFFFTIAGICFAVAWLTYEAGLSYSLGAFVAGLIIGESEFSIDAMSNIIPLRDIFAAIFFMSIGMLLDTSVLLTHYTIIISIVLVILFVKILTGWLSTAVLGLPLRVSIFTGLALAQIGEFSFVLAKSGLDLGLVPDGPYQYFLAAAIITMAMTPFVMNSAPAVTNFISRVAPRRIVEIGSREEQPEKQEQDLTDHIIVIGYGMTGKSAAHAAFIAGIPYAVIDMDPEIIRTGQKEDPGHRFFFGDGTYEEVLVHAGIEKARAVVIAVSGQDAIPQIVHAAREKSPSAFILVRTRYVRDVKRILELGADEVVPEEFGTSVEVFARVLAKYIVSREDMDRFVNRIRGSTYLPFARISPGNSLEDFTEKFRNFRFHTLHVAPAAMVAEKTLSELDFRKKYGIVVFALRRGDSTLSFLDNDMRIHGNDDLILFGSDSDIQSLRPLFAGADNPAENVPGGIGTRGNSGMEF
ncbi:MAG: cation:proton antiporter, partial [Methanoregulaceae archaeon]